MTEKVPKSELEELVERWREEQEHSKELAEEAKQGVTGGRRFPEGFWSGLERAASNLEAVLEE